SSRTPVLHLHVDAMVGAGAQDEGRQTPRNIPQYLRADFLITLDCLLGERTDPFIRRFALGSGDSDDRRAWTSGVRNRRLFQWGDVLHVGLWGRNASGANRAGYGGSGGRPRVRFSGRGHRISARGVFRILQARSADRAT